MLSAEEKRALLVRSKARAFARDVRMGNMAIKLPDEIIDWLKDDEIPTFKRTCEEFRIRQRDDFFWEAV